MERRCPRGAQPELLTAQYEPPRLSRSLSHAAGEADPRCCLEASTSHPHAKPWSWSSARCFCSRRSCGNGVTSFVPHSFAHRSRCQFALRCTAVHRTGGRSSFPSDTGENLNHLAVKTLAWIFTQHSSPTSVPCRFSVRTLRRVPFFVFVLKGVGRSFLCCAELLAVSIHIGCDIRLAFFRIPVIRTGMV